MTMTTSLNVLRGTSIGKKPLYLRLTKRLWRTTRWTSMTVSTKEATTTMRKKLPHANRTNDLVVAASSTVTKRIMVTRMHPLKPRPRLVMRTTSPGLQRIPAWQMQLKMRSELGYS
jgi:hypothetical protein